MNYEDQGILAQRKPDPLTRASASALGIAQLPVDPVPAFVDDLGSEGAIAYFLGDLITAKLPVLADCMASRSGMGTGIDESKRAAVIVEANKTISDANEMLAVLNSITQ